MEADEIEKQLLDIQTLVADGTRLLAKQRAFLAKLNPNTQRDLIETTESIIATLIDIQAQRMRILDDLRQDLTEILSRSHR